MVCAVSYATSLCVPAALTFYAKKSLASAFTWVSNDMKQTRLVYYALRRPLELRYLINDNIYHQAVHVLGTAFSRMNVNGSPPACQCPTHFQQSFKHKLCQRCLKIHNANPMGLLGLHPAMNSVSLTRPARDKVRVIFVGAAWVDIVA